MEKLARFVIAALLPMAAWSQQTIVLRDGARLYGRVTAVNERTITFADRDGGIHTLDNDRVDLIQFEHSDRHDAARDDRGYSAAAPQNYGPTTLAAGTAISVRTNESIDTQSATESRSYSAQVGQDVTDADGNVAIPRGSGARLIVRRLNDGVLALDLQSVSVNGSRYLVETGDVLQGGRRDGVGDNKRTAEFGGGGAVLGTLLGAIAGGGKGAAIGALAGGAVGIGAEIATRGPVVRVPAETVLNFRLDNAVYLRAAPQE